MTGEMLENGPHNFVYRHGLRATISHFGYYALAFYGTLSSALLLLFQFKPHGYQVWTLVTLYASALGISLLLAGVMTYRRLRTNVVVIGSSALQMPHYWTSSVPYRSIRGVYANRPQKGAVSIMVDGQIVRFLYMKYLEPVTSAAEFAAKLNARVIASLDESSAVAQRVANKLAQRQFGNPWFCGICSFILLSLHALAWNAGSRFDGLDIIASAAAFNPIAFLSDPMRIIDTTLLHASWVHVLTNFMGFAVYGSVIERILGWRCVLAMFVVGSIVSIAASVIFSGTDLRVGASGGVMSFLGVFLFIVAIKPFPLPGTMLGMPMWIFVPLSVLSLGIFVPGVDWVAHTAGVTTGILAGAIMFRGAKQRSIDELLPVRIPTVLFLGCCVLIGAAIIDVSMRVTNLARGGRAATIEQILHSSASSDLITDVAWDELIERRESQSAVPNTIARLRQDHHLSAISRGFLAALLSIRGDADAAFAEQRAALLAVKSDDPARASRYAARLVRFAEEVPTAARMDLIASERCMEEISVQRAAGVPTRLEFFVHTKVGNEQHAANANDREQLSLRAAASTDCRASKSAWRINPDDWNHTVAMFHR